MIHSLLSDLARQHLQPMFGTHIYSLASLIGFSLAQQDLPSNAESWSWMMLVDDSGAAVSGLVTVIFFISTYIV